MTLSILVLDACTPVGNQPPEKKIESENIVTKDGAIDSVVTAFTDSRDGEVYGIVKIGDQIWMAENLRYNAAGSYLNPNNPDKKYGRLYSWSQAMGLDKSYNDKVWGGSDVKHRGICPSGWHLPSDLEWISLEKSLGFSPETLDDGWRGSHGKLLKSQSGWADNGNGNNASGFNALPAGYYHSFESHFETLGQNAYFWSATDYDAFGAWYRALNSGLLQVQRLIEGKSQGYSCRCLKD